jgi:hypothetical protein
MAKYMPDATINSMLNVLGGTSAGATELCICSTQPTTYAEAHATYMLASVALTPASAFSIADGDTSGRKVTLAAQNGISVTASGTALHYALTITGSSTLLLVGTVTSQALTSGNTVNFPATDVDEIRDYA